MGLVHAQNEQKAAEWPLQEDRALRALSRCAGDAQLDTDRLVMRCLKGKVCNPDFLILAKKHNYINNSQEGENLHTMKMLLDIFN